MVPVGDPDTPLVPVAPADDGVWPAAGSGLAGVAVPDVPVAPDVPAVPAVPVVPAVPTAVPAAAAGSLPSGPSRELRFASTLAYAARQSACVVISSLKFEISWETCVRLSP